MTQNVVLSVNTSAAASMPLYFSITGAVAAAAVASRRALHRRPGVLAVALVEGVGSRASIVVRTLAEMSA